MDALKKEHIAVLDGDNLRPAHHVAAIDRIVDASKTKTFWEFVDEVILSWERVNPGKWREQVVEVQNSRDNLRDKKFATTESKHMERRFLLRMPEFVNVAITKFFPDVEMDRKFYNTFARRYPALRVSEKI